MHMKNCVLEEMAANIKRIFVLIWNYIMVVFIMIDVRSYIMLKKQSFINLNMNYKKNIKNQNVIMISTWFQAEID